MDIRINKDHDGLYFAGVFNGAFLEYMDKDADVCALVSRIKREYAVKVIRFDSASERDFYA